VATVRQALDAATLRLEASSRTPRRDAELLLMRVLGWDRAALLTRPERILCTAETVEYQALLTRREAAEPMQYITGVQQFFGLDFKVTREVLIPRPETELVVEALLDRVNRDQPLRIVDVGTGSGAIAVALAHALPNSQITAVDLSEPALAVARENAAQHGVLERVRLVHADLLAGCAPRSFEAVVSNPPYVAGSEVLEAQVRDYEPATALYAGPSGLEIYEQLIPQARETLTPGGWLILEIGYGQRDAVSALLREWADLKFQNDLQGIPRVAAARVLRGRRDAASRPFVVDGAPEDGGVERKT
jgi:release factor glutamine methyltransferase